MRPVQAAQLYRYEEQEEDDGEIDAAEVLSGLPDAYLAQGGEGLKRGGTGVGNVGVPGLNARVSSSNWQSTGLQIRGLQVRSLPGPSLLRAGMLTTIEHKEAQ